MSSPGLWPACHRRPARLGWRQAGGGEDVPTTLRHVSPSYSKPSNNDTGSSTHLDHSPRSRTPSVLTKRCDLTRTWSCCCRSGESMEGRRWIVTGRQLYEVCWILITVMSCRVGATGFTHPGTWRPTDTSLGLTGSYCETETFAPSCPEGNVVIVTHAEYGRMELGSCVVEDYGHLGCYVDVRDELDVICSGHESCQIYVPDPTLKNKNSTCPQAFKPYLNASYVCVKVEKDGCRMCQGAGANQVATVNSSRGYLAGLVSTQDSNKCGYSGCPWNIQVASGQKINVRLLDFTRGRLGTASDQCSRVALIKDTSADTVFPLCVGMSRITETYSSLSSSIQISFVETMLKNIEGQILLYYEAVGCPDFAPKKNMWMNRRDDELSVGCKDDDQTWTLHCEGTEWRGDYGTCKDKVFDPKQPPALPLGILIAIVVGIALVIGFLILTIGVVCLKRHHLARRHYPQSGTTTLYVPASQEPEYREELMLQGPYYNNTRKKRKARPTAQPKSPHGGRENLYARGMESRPLPSIPNVQEQCAAGEDSDGSDKIQVVRTNSGSEKCHYHPRVVLRTTGGSSRGVVTPVTPHVPTCPSLSSSHVPPTPTGSASGSGSGSGLIVAKSGSKCSSSGGGGAACSGPGTPPVAGAAGAAGPSVPTGTGSGTPTPASAKDDPQYFVLETDQDGGDGQARRQRASSAQQDALSSSQAAQCRGPLKSPEEENAENVNKETLGPDRQAMMVSDRQVGLPLQPNTRTDNNEDLEVWVLMLRSQNYYIV